MELREDTDRVIVPYERGPYQTAEELWAIKAEKALVIQTFWRSHVARTEVARRRKERDQERRRLRAEAEEAARKEEAARQREIMRRVQPRTAEDFATLKSELETWRVAQTMNITDMDMEPHDRHSEVSSAGD